LGKKEVANLAHNAQLIANNALQYVLMNTLSIKDKTTSKVFHIYPNPTKGKLFINIDDKINEIKLYSMTGSLLKSFLKKENVNLETFSPVFYILKVNSKQIKILKK
jgi:hypothetical protein